MNWFDVKAEWVCTDGLQWRKLINATTFHLVEVREYPDGYIYVSEIVDVNDYDDNEKESIIKSYYHSMEEFKASYPEEEINGILAECIFEQTQEMELMFCSSVFKTEDEAESNALEYISKQ